MIKTQPYLSINDFVEVNNLEEQANELFGQDWEPEYDSDMAQELCDHIESGKYVVVPNDNSGKLNSDFEFEVFIPTRNTDS